MPRRARKMPRSSRSKNSSALARSSLAARSAALWIVRAVACTIRNAADLAASDDRAKALLFFDLRERGIFLARRGLVALSLPFGDGQADELVSAVDAIVTARRAVLPRVG